jgi:predicted adenylyl cyclase CyaB
MPGLRIIETKVRDVDLDRARATLSRTNGRMLGARSQHDTYFQVTRGWLKLRVEDPGCAELVAYLRDLAESSRTCDYAVTAVADATMCRAGLAATLGVLVEVRKQREVWSIDHTRIHLDRVQGLGDFIELESPADDQESHLRCAALIDVDPAMDIRASYSELLRSAHVSHGEQI